MSTEPHPRDVAIAAGQYVRSISNRDKHQYAVARLVYLRGDGPEPERPIGLSAMGAQAVEMRLAAIFAGED